MDLEKIKYLIDEIEFRGWILKTKFDINNVKAWRGKKVIWYNNDNPELLLIIDDTNDINTNIIFLSNIVNTGLMSNINAIYQSAIYWDEINYDNVEIVETLLNDMKKTKIN